MLPPGGWLRALRYNRLRLLRISDDPRRIALGVFVGTFVAFTPFFGAHFLLAPALAWAAGGNVLASLLATMICNPVSFPVIAYAAIQLGSRILRTGKQVDRAGVETAFESFWHSLVSGLKGGETDWSAVSALFEQVLLPYLVGGSLLGLVAAALAAWLSERAVKSFRKLRRRAVKTKRNVS